MSATLGYLAVFTASALAVTHVIETRGGAGVLWVVFVWSVIGLFHALSASNIPMGHARAAVSTGVVEMVLLGGLVGLPIGLWRRWRARK